MEEGKSHIPLPESEKNPYSLCGSEYGLYSLPWSHIPSAELCGGYLVNFACLVSGMVAWCNILYFMIKSVRFHGVVYHVTLCHCDRQG